MNGYFGSGLFFEPPAACTTAIADGKTAGLTATDTFVDGEGKTVLWKRAPEVCGAYEKLHALRQVITAIQPQLQAIAAFTGADGKPDPSATGDAFRFNVEKARQCVKTIDEALTKSVPSDVKFAPNDNGSEARFTLAEARTRCNNWIELGGNAAKADDDRVAAEIAALKAKYAKFGITGDRLTYLVKNGHHPIMGKGCVELAGKTFKSSPVFYELGQDDLAWIVYKTAFNGDKQVSYTSRRYRKDGNWGCK